MGRERSAGRFRQSGAVNAIAARSRSPPCRRCGRRTGKQYLPRLLEPVPYANSGVGIYATQRGVEINLSVFRAYGEDDLADALLATYGDAIGHICYGYCENQRK